MCGIIAGFNTTTPKAKNAKATKAEQINDGILTQYEDQYNRGQKGFGLIRIEPNGKINIDRATEPTKFLLDLYMKPATMIIAHHRQPTSTENKIQQTHPIHVSNKLLKFDYYAVHNGLISNDEELKKKHEELGFQYTTKCMEFTSQYYRKDAKEKWNDSEAIAIELALFIEGKIKAIRTDNSAAFVILQVNKKTNIAQRCFFGRNGFSSALNMSKSRGKLFISSEGQGDEIKENKLYSFNIRDEKMKLDSRVIPFKKEEKPKEIEIEKTTQGHHASCKCIDCVKADPSKKSSTAITDVSIIPVEDEKDTTQGKVITSVRSWVDLEKDPVLDLDFDAAIFTDKNYKETACEEFRYKIKGSNTNTITSVLDDTLDEEIEKIADLCTNFKEICTTNKIELPERNFFISQIANLFKTMEAITDIASDEFLIAQQKEDEDDIRDYNVGFEPNYDVGSRHYDGVSHMRSNVHIHGQGIREDIDRDDINDFNRFG